SDGSENWTNDNFLALKNVLQNCLPYIRYFQISEDDIVNNVQPYHQILDRNLWKDITKKVVNSNRKISSIILPPRTILIPTLPSRTTGSFSTIINKAHAAEIATWIDKITVPYTDANNPY